MEFQEVYEKYYPIVYKYLIKLTKDDVLAEEYTQETFFKALKNIKKYDPDKNMLTWLCTIAKNLFYTDVQKNKKRNRVKVVFSTIAAIAILLVAGYASYIPEKTINYSDGMVSVDVAEDGVMEVYMNENYKNMYANYSVDDNGEIVVYVSAVNNLLSSTGIMNSGKDVNGMALVIGNAICVGYGNTGDQQRQFDSPNGEMLENIKAIYYVNASKNELDQAVTDRENGIHNHPVTDQEFLANATLVWSK